MIDEAEAETVRRIYRLYIGGHQGSPIGMKAIATLLNRQGLTMRGRPVEDSKTTRNLIYPAQTGYANGKCKR
jgi:site-specific DNA recombinase